MKQKNSSGRPFQLWLRNTSL
uniref:Uncharacterized protein n=1 Tax=Anguilla anguilla TaxID=7936 RepID=A0A0E9PGM5_ANGAN